MRQAGCSKRVARLLPSSVPTADLQKRPFYKAKVPISACKSAYFATPKSLFQNFIWLKQVKNMVMDMWRYYLR